MREWANIALQRTCGGRAPLRVGVEYRIEIAPAVLFESAWLGRGGAQELVLPIDLAGLTGVGFGYNERKKGDKTK